MYNDNIVERCVNVVEFCTTMQNVVQRFLVGYAPIWCTLLIDISNFVLESQVI